MREILIEIDGQMLNQFECLYFSEEPLQLFVHHETLLLQLSEVDLDMCELIECLVISDVLVVFVELCNVYDFECLHDSLSVQLSIVMISVGPSNIKQNSIYLNC